MKIEHIYNIIGCVLSLIMLIVFIPKNKIREAWLIFLFKQLITWLLGIIVVELRLIEYPVRFFPYAIKTSFAFEFLVFPALCAIFIINFPDKKSTFRKFMHYFYFCTGITIVEVIAEKYTNIINYINWTWYITWITLFITFYISRKFYLWFFRLNKYNDTR